MLSNIIESKEDMKLGIFLVPRQIVPETGLYIPPEAVRKP
jgi:hypothetical protein